VLPAQRDMSSHRLAAAKIAAVRVASSRVLLAPQEDVWGFLAEPRHLADWWPGIAAIEPDRRGLAPGARWQVRRPPAVSLFRRNKGEELLLVRAVDHHQRVAWHFPASGLDAQLVLEATARDRTKATLTLERRFLLGPVRELPRVALGRLHSLIQTAATL
jgi:uncharacterized protein YndB with AHSA1/START domain